MPTRVPLPFVNGFGNASSRSGKPKSDLFTAVETALATYVGANSRPNLIALTRALGSWKRSKGGNGAWTNSVRAAPVQQLSDWLIQESEAIGIFPTSRPIWNNNHNCYAYSMLCDRPRGLGQNSRPGRYAGNARSRRQDFAQGVIDDAAADGKVVTVVANPPHNIPAVYTDGTYLVAMVANAVGYHFMRRRESTGLWTHKNGAPSEVETYFYDSVQEEPMAITDLVAARIFANPQLIGCGMTFESFFKVPQAGVQVEG
jgi:hypothetical protein